MAAMTSAFQTVPTAEYGRRSVRWVGIDHPVEFNEPVPYSVHEEYSLKPISVLGIFIPNVEYRSFSPYVGAVAFTLGILGAILAWRERHVRWLATLSLAGLIFSLGPNSLLHGILYALVPLVEKARVPGAGTLVFAIGFAPLVAYGADLLPRPEFVRWSNRTAWALGIFAVIVATTAFVIFALKIQPATDNRLIIPAIAALLFVAILALWRHSSVSASTGVTAVLGLVLFELANVSTASFPNRYQPELNPYLHRLAEHTDMIDYIRNRGDAARIEYDDNVLPYNIGDWYGVETLNSYTASATTNIWKMDLFSPRGKDFFGIKYYLGKASPNPNYIEDFTGRSGLKVFENPTAFPRAWSVHRAAAPGAMHANFDARNVVAMDGTLPALGSCSRSQDQVELPLHRPNRVVIAANLQCPGMVILTDTWFPGWRASVDGKPAKIYEVDGGVRGVLVSAGRHTIEMRYLPWSVFSGAALSLLATIVTILAWRSSSS